MAIRLWKRVEEELSGFIHFGGLLHADHRRLIARMMVRFLYDPNYDPQEDLEKFVFADTEKNWKPLIHQFFSETALRMLTAHNEDLSLSVSKHSLTWIKKTARTIFSQDKYQKEALEFQHWKDNGNKFPSPQWQVMVIELTARYPDFGKNWHFYASRVAELATQAGGQSLQQERAILHNNILDDWKELLQAKQLNYQKTLLEEAFGKYFQDLRQKYQQLNQLGDLMAPYYRYFGNLWSVPFGEWESIPWEDIEAYIQLLKNDRRVKELADMLGRWEVADMTYQEEKLETINPQQEWRVNPIGKSEIVGVHQSDQISAILPNEIALLSQPETEIIFSKKYVEKKLLTFQYQAMEQTTRDVIQEKLVKQPEVDQKGPIILCMDTSGSMFGKPELVAKAIAFVLTSIAKKQERDCYLIAFSDQIKTLNLSKATADLDTLIEFIQLSFHGSTDIQPALKEALKMLKEQTYKKADVLVISDFILPRVENWILDQIAEARRDHNTRFHSLYITRQVVANAVPMTIFDHHWTYDMENPQVLRQTLAELEGL